MDKRRILVVEDDDILRETFMAVLSGNGYFVDGVGNVDDALRAIERRSFHAALVDIMLADNDTSNRDGATILMRLNDSNEATQAIVVSGQTVRAFVRDALKDLGAFDYIDKDELQEKGNAFLLAKVSDAVARSTSLRSARWEDVIAAVVPGVSEEAFVSDCLRYLEFQGGFENLSRILLAAYEQLAPLISQRSASSVLRRERSPLVVSGTFWSKGRGTATDLLIYGKNCSQAVLDDVFHVSSAPSEYYRSKADLSIRALGRPDLRREDFLER